MVALAKLRKKHNPVILENHMNILYYLAAAILMLTMSVPAKADLLKHLEGKKLVYVGVCWFDKDGTLTFDNKARKTVLDCSVGMALPDETKHYVLLYHNKKPSKLVMYDETTKKQVTLWVGNSI